MNDADGRAADAATVADDVALHHLDIAVAGDGLTPVFQPIVSLPDGAVIGFEALARWRHLGDVAPEVVFAHAAGTGREGSLERMCIDTATEAALAAELPTGTALFINCETTTPHVGRAESSSLARAAERYQLVFELTERSLLNDPPRLLSKVAALRSDGFAIALDDVGADPAPLALLDVVAPDVIKLDLAVVQSQSRYDRARTWAAVLAQHERAGAVVLAEGIEEDAHVHRAIALGATLGQGFKYGHPGPVSVGRQIAAGWMPPSRPDCPCRDIASPFDALAARVPIRQERKDTVLALSRYLEQQAVDAMNPPIVLASVQRAEFFRGRTRRCYERLAAAAPLVAVFGEDVPEHPGTRVRGACITADDSLSTQWIVLMLGASDAAALVAREVTDGIGTVADRDRRFDVMLTHDRDLVTAAACMLLSRMT